LTIMIPARFSVAFHYASATVASDGIAKAASRSDAKAPSNLLSLLISPRLKAGCKDQPSEAGLRTHISAQANRKRYWERIRDHLLSPDNHSSWCPTMSSTTHTSGTIPVETPRWGVSIRTEQHPEADQAARREPRPPTTAKPQTFHRHHPVLLGAVAAATRAPGQSSNLTPVSKAV